MGADGHANSGPGTEHGVDGVAANDCLEQSPIGTDRWKPESMLYGRILPTVRSQKVIDPLLNNSID